MHACIHKYICIYVYFHANAESLATLSSQQLSSDASLTDSLDLLGDSVCSPSLCSSGVCSPESDIPTFYSASIFQHDCADKEDEIINALIAELEARGKISRRTDKNKSRRNLSHHQLKVSCVIPRAEDCPREERPSFQHHIGSHDSAIAGVSASCTLSHCQASLFRPSGGSTLIGMISQHTNGSAASIFKTAYCEKAVIHAEGCADSQKSVPSNDPGQRALATVDNGFVYDTISVFQVSSLSHDSATATGSVYLDHTSPASAETGVFLQAHKERSSEAVEAAVLSKQRKNACSLVVPSLGMDKLGYKRDREREHTLSNAPDANITHVQAK